MDLRKLYEPFPPDAVSWRVGSTTKDKSKGLALAYIDARDVMNRLDEVCGVAYWQDHYEFHGARTICYLSLRADGDEWVTKADGAGDSDVEAEKGSISDAFKRAAVKWGIGRYLYDLESPWVELDTKTVGDKVFVNGIAKHEMKRLEAILRGVKTGSPSHATMPGYTFSKTAPSPDMQDLWDTTYGRAEAGMDALGAWWKADLTKAERQSLQPWLDNFKAIANEVKA